MNTTPGRRGRPRIRASTSTLDPVKDVLAASASLFARKSYDGTSMTDIARAVGLQRASLYHYFPNKQAIFFELMKRYMFPLYELIRRWEAEGVGGQGDQEEQDAGHQDQRPRASLRHADGQDPGRRDAVAGIAVA